MSVVAIVGIAVGGVVIAGILVATVLSFKYRNNRRNRLRRLSMNEKGFTPYEELTTPDPAIPATRAVNYDDPRFRRAVDQYHTAGQSPAYDAYRGF
jgi:hypothetical protein